MTIVIKIPRVGPRVPWALGPGPGGWDHMGLQQLIVPIQQLNVPIQQLIVPKTVAK
jgi:hypothetical protein